MGEGVPVIQDSLLSKLMPSRATRAGTMRARVLPDAEMDRRYISDACMWMHGAHASAWVAHEHNGRMGGAWHAWVVHGNTWMVHGDAWVVHGNAWDA